MFDVFVDRVVGRFRMASVVISVPTTASRFALLQVDSDSESDSDGETEGGSRSREAPLGEISQWEDQPKNDKKKEKRRRKKEQQQSEANEVKICLFLSKYLSIYLSISRVWITGEFGGEVWPPKEGLIPPDGCQN